MGQTDKTIGLPMPVYSWYLPYVRAHFLINHVHNNMNQCFRNEACHKLSSMHGDIMNLFHHLASLILEVM